MIKELSQFLAPSGQKLQLKNFSTEYTGDLNKCVGKDELEASKKNLSTYQEILYAENSRAVLILFQAMDAGGKDSAISHVMSGLNPQGCEVYSFKTPTSSEYAHDFLWRHHLALPQKGRIGIHNRSHYENVLICKVHPEYVLKEKIPGYDEIKKIDKAFWQTRYESIRNFEKHLTENGTVILKFFLYVSEKEQKERLLDRINDPLKNWKFSSADLTERELWGKYIAVYEEAITETSTENAPWFIIPADKKWYARLMISRILEQTFKNLNLKFPVLPAEELAELEKYKKKLLGRM